MCWGIYSGISQSTGVCRFSEINELGPLYSALPQFTAISVRVFRIGGLPNVLGCLFVEEFCVALPTKNN